MIWVPFYKGKIYCEILLFFMSWNSYFVTLGIILSLVINYFHYAEKDLHIKKTEEWWKYPEG